MSNFEYRIFVVIFYDIILFFFSGSFGQLETAPIGLPSKWVLNCRKLLVLTWKDKFSSPMFGSNKFVESILLTGSSNQFRNHESCIFTNHAITINLIGGKQCENLDPSFQNWLFDSVNKIIKLKSGNLKSTQILCLAILPPFLAIFFATCIFIFHKI